MIKSKKQMFIIIGSFLLVMLLGTVTYAFFNYTRTGAANTLQVGRIAFISRQTNTISLSNLFPINPTITGIMDDATKVGTLEIEVEGDTDYSEGVEYLISSTNTNIYTSTGKTVPISISMTVDSLGTSSANYFTARENTNESIYKRLVRDTIVGDQMLLVGFIKSNSTPGTASGVDGSITIKAYLDKNKIVVSDTLENGPVEVAGYTNETDDEWVAGRTVLTTSEWNSLQGVGVSFKVKVEANKGIWVNGSLEEIMKKSAVMDNISSTYVNASTGINFGAVSGDNNGKGVYIRAGTENDTYPVMYYRGDVNDNNVKFANKCWKAVRTTDTGGVKLIYNGEYTEQGKCNNAETGTQITLTENNTSVNTFKFNENTNSPAYVGYMYGTVYEISSDNWISGAKFGSSFTWDGTNYKLVDATLTSPDDTHHYSCNMTDANATCTNLRYVYYGTSTKYYITLQNGKSVEDALNEMKTNTTNSIAKAKIEAWYASNMSEFTNRIEDTVYCNDRSVYSLGGWNSYGGSLSNMSINYGAMQRVYVDYSPSIVCPNKSDSFTWKKGNGNQKLQYPIGLLTVDEIVMAGGASNTNISYYLTTGNYYWSLSPSYFNYNYGYEFRVINDGYLSSDYYVSDALGLRPVVSLKPGTPVVSGTGTVLDPYVIG